MENIKEFADMPAEFLKEGTLFMNRCTSRTLITCDFGWH